MSNETDIADWIEREREGARQTGYFNDTRCFVQNIDVIVAALRRVPAQGKPVAWLYETWNGEDSWSQKYSDAEIVPQTWIRNIRPLYLAPPAEGQPAKPAYSAEMILRSYETDLRRVMGNGNYADLEAAVSRAPAASAETTTCKHCGEVMSYHPAPTSEMAVEMRALADEFDGEAKAHGAIGDKDEKVKCLRAAYALRRLADCQSPAANAEQRRAEVCAAVAHVLHGRNRQCDYPIYETQDDRGLDEAEYIDFAMDVLASLRSRSQPVTASQREIAINLLGWPSPEKAAEALLSKFNVTCKTTEEPRG